MDFVVSNQWAEEEFGKAEVWDRRCLKSLSKMAYSIHKNQTLSFSSACGESLRQCGTRIFSHESTKVEKMQSGHYQQTAKRASRCETVLIAQDTTSFNYSGHKATSGLGYIGTDGRSRGIMAHTALVLREDGLPLGIIGQKLWVRKDEDRGKKHKRKELAIEDKESYKWVEGLQWSQERLPEQIKEIWVIGDRESDVYGYMATDRRPNVNLLVRATQPRIIEAEISGEKKRGRLTDLVKQIPITARKQIELERSNRTTTVNISVSSSNIRLLPPARQSEGSPLEMSVIYAVEEGPEKKDKIEWILLCFKRDLSPSDSLKILDYYTHRWKVERLHYALKTGVYNVEKLQFDDAETLMNALAFYSVIAWRTLFLAYYARLEPKSPYNEIIDDDDKEVLEAYTEGKIETVLEAVMAIGKLGGFLGGSKRYPYPGIKVLWIGIVKLIAMKQGWLMAKAHYKKR